MKRPAAILVAAAVLGATPVAAAAQHAAKPFRLPGASRTDRHHLRTSTSDLNLVQPSPPAFMPGGPGGPGGAPPHLRAARSLPVRLGWSATDVALASGFTAALLLDHGQTRALARGGWRGWRETNPILGPRPSVGQLDTYTAVAGLAVLGAAAALPRRVRPWLLGAAFVVESFTVTSTVRRGVGIRLP